MNFNNISHQYFIRIKYYQLEVYEVWTFTFEVFTNFINFNLSHGEYSHEIKILFNNETVPFFIACQILEKGLVYVRFSEENRSFWQKKFQLTPPYLLPAKPIKIFSFAIKVQKSQKNNWALQTHYFH